MKIILIVFLFYLILKISNFFKISKKSKVDSDDNYIDAEFEEID